MELSAIRTQAPSQRRPVLGVQRKGPEISRSKGRNKSYFDPSESAQGWHELISGGGFRIANRLDPSEAALAHF
jgi:hypothetical protein